MSLFRLCPLLLVTTSGAMCGNSSIYFFCFSWDMIFGPFALPIGRLLQKAIITELKALLAISKRTLFALMSLCKKPMLCTWTKVLANVVMMWSQVALSKIVLPDYARCIVQICNFPCSRGTA